MGISPFSCTQYLERNYPFYRMFLPDSKLRNDVLTERDLQELMQLIKERDHYSIRQLIAKRKDQWNN